VNNYKLLDISIYLFTLQRTKVYRISVQKCSENNEQTKTHHSSDVLQVEVIYLHITKLLCIIYFVKFVFNVNQTLGRLFSKMSPMLLFRGVLR